MNIFKTEDPPPFLDNIVEHIGSFIGVRSGMQCWQLKDPTVEPFKSITKKTRDELAHCHFPRSSVVIFEFYICGANLAPPAVYVVLQGASKHYRKKAVRRLKKSCLARDYFGLMFDQWDWESPELEVVMKGLSSWPRPPPPLVYDGQEYQIWLDGLTQALTIGNGKGSSHSQSGVISGLIRGRDHGFGFGVMDYILSPAHIFLTRADQEDSFMDASPESGSQSDSGNSSHCMAVETSSRFNMLREGSATPFEMQASLSRSGSNAESTNSDPTTPDDLSETYKYSKTPSQSSPDLDVPFALVTSRVLDYVLIPIDHHTDIGNLLREKLRILSNDDTIDLPAANVQGTGTVIATITLPSFPCPITGTLSTRPIMMRLPFSRDFQRLYTMHLPVPVQQGESGSIVSDPFSGKIYGIVVAGSVEGKVVYLMPAAEILDDVAHRLEMNSLDKITRISRMEEEGSSDHVQDGWWRAHNAEALREQLLRENESLMADREGFRAQVERLAIDNQRLGDNKEMLENSLRGLQAKYDHLEQKYESIKHLENTNPMSPPLKEHTWSYDSDILATQAKGSDLEEWLRGDMPWTSARTNLLEAESTTGPEPFGSSNEFPRDAARYNSPPTMYFTRPRSSTEQADPFSWTEAEKRCLIAEVLKSSHVKTQALMDIVTAHGITIERQDWFTMQLPPGRSIQECIEMFQALWKHARLDARLPKKSGQAPGETETVRPWMATSATNNQPLITSPQSKGKMRAVKRTRAVPAPAPPLSSGREEPSRPSKAAMTGLTSHPDLQDLEPGLLRTFFHQTTESIHNYGTDEVMLYNWDDDYHPQYESKEDTLGD